MAANTYAFAGKTMAGAMTYILINKVKNNAGITYGDLLDKMHDVIDQTNDKRCLNLKLLQKGFCHRRIQDPLLTGSEEFDVHSKKFGL
ncbi:hypothetical protein CJ030_MR7G008194 [Morella rubra]|uniref:Uncharacterized protein n=1 Tax=Morella rubra TaxID=262757 RepID=A0A6A1V6T3_9ROSI|nr:hypothetical protein CJ030_MR7G008194 [Morella rubra]